MLKEHIITVTLELFARNGVRKVSMDDVAAKAGVSKRTLYEFFDDKETLLVQILDTFFKRIGEYLDRLTKETWTALEIALLLNEKLTDTPVRFCEAFYEDIRRYPAAYECVKRNKQHFMSMSMFLLRKGVSEGVFRSDIDFDLIARLADKQLDMQQPSPTCGPLSHADVHNTLFLIFMRGICTCAGWKILERYCVTNPFRANVRGGGGDSGAPSVFLSRSSGKNGRSVDKDLEE
ncbi:MAG: TetR/AcrR family transcriptional regulator [Tannerella sp.]|jgi:AcrR family transcriptional regulator|nr:TetR/AcrR family transcriptional regulator [Tannerella sp.]